MTTGTHQELLNEQAAGAPQSFKIQQQKYYRFTQEVVELLYNNSNEQVRSK